MFNRKKRFWKLFYWTQNVVLHVCFNRYFTSKEIHMVLWNHIFCQIELSSLYGWQHGWGYLPIFVWLPKWYTLAHCRKFTPHVKLCNYQLNKSKKKIVPKKQVHKFDWQWSCPVYWSRWRLFDVFTSYVIEYYLILMTITMNTLWNQGGTHTDQITC